MIERTLSSAGGFNLADELAMAETSDNEEEDPAMQEGDSGFLGVMDGRTSGLSERSDYTGSEYEDVEEDGDGYLSERLDYEAVELRRLEMEFEREGGGGQGSVVARFVEELRGMRGQMDVENHARRYTSSHRLLSLPYYPQFILLACSWTVSNPWCRYRLITMQRSLASAIDGHLRLLRDIPLLSPHLHLDPSFHHLLSTLPQSLPTPVPISALLSDSSLDLTPLSDTLAMTRQDQLLMTRKLRSVHDAWIERKTEWQVLETRIAWLEEHDSVERRGRGSCAREVDGVVRGFGKVLGGLENEMYASPFP